METKINVAEILKNKPQGTKLYDWLHNLEVELDEVATTEIETVIWCTKKDEDYNLLFGYSRLVTLRGWFDGLQILLPSKEMRDWSKFAWKKGDVLVGVGRRIIFEKFIDENYTRFQGKYSLSTYEDKMLVADKRCYTSNFRKLDDSGNVENYFKELEEELGGKLNRETLEVEKVQPEFKDGDIVCIYREATFDTIDKALRFCGLDRQVINSKVLEIEPTSIKDMVSKDKLTEDELINLRGLLNLFSDRYRLRLSIENRKAIACVQRAIDRILGV
jgi:hypothetical protein